MFKDFFFMITFFYKTKTLILIYLYIIFLQHSSWQCVTNKQRDVQSQYFLKIQKIKLYTICIKQPRVFLIFVKRKLMIFIRKSLQDVIRVLIALSHVATDCFYFGGDNLSIPYYFRDLSNNKLVRIWDGTFRGMPQVVFL